MRLLIDPSVSQLSPYFACAVVRVCLKAEARASSSALDELKASALRVFNASIPSAALAELEAQPNISQWFDVYKAMGLKPKKKTKPTHYAFCSRVLKEQKWPRSIGPLVDVYLANQLKHVMPHGGFDVASLTQGTIVLHQAQQEYAFQPLGVPAAEPERFEQTSVGEYIYRDLGDADAADAAAAGTRVLTRHLNYRDGEATKICDEADEAHSTRDFVLFVEALDASAAGRENLKRTAEDLEQAYVAVYGAESVERSYVRIVELGKGAGTAELALDW